LVRGGAEEGAPRCRRDGGGAMPWRRLAGEAGRGWPAGDLLWGERVPFPGSIGAGEGRTGVLHGELGGAVAMVAAGGAPAGEDERKRAGEDQWEEGELLGGADAAAEG